KAILLRWLPRFVHEWRRGRERPLSHYAGPNEKCGNAENDFQQAPLACRARLPEEPAPTEHRKYGRQRVEPHFEREFVRAPAVMQEHNANGLADELDDQTHGEDAGYGRFQIQQDAEGEGQRPKRQQGDVRKMFRGMYLGEDREEVAVERRGIGNT